LRQRCADGSATAGKSIGPEGNRIVVQPEMGILVGHVLFGEKANSDLCAGCPAFENAGVGPSLGHSEPAMAIIVSAIFVDIFETAAFVDPAIGFRVRVITDIGRSDAAVVTPAKTRGRPISSVQIRVPAGSITGNEIVDLAVY